MHVQILTENLFPNCRAEHEMKTTGSHAIKGLRAHNSKWGMYLQTEE